MPPTRRTSKKRGGEKENISTGVERAYKHFSFVPPKLVPDVHPSVTQAPVLFWPKPPDRRPLGRLSCPSPTRKRAADPGPLEGARFEESGSSKRPRLDAGGDLHTPPTQKEAHTFFADGFLRKEGFMRVTPLVDGQWACTAPECTHVPFRKESLETHLILKHPHRLPDDRDFASVLRNVGLEPTIGIPPPFLATPPRDGLFADILACRCLQEGESLRSRDVVDDCHLLQRFGLVFLPQLSFLCCKLCRILFPLSQFSRHLLDSHKTQLRECHKAQLTAEEPIPIYLLSSAYKLAFALHLSARLGIQADQDLAAFDSTLYIKPVPLLDLHHLIRCPHEDCAALVPCEKLDSHASARHRSKKSQSGPKLQCQPSAAYGQALFNNVTGHRTAFWAVATSLEPDAVLPESLARRCPSQCPNVLRQVSLHKALSTMRRGRGRAQPLSCTPTDLVSRVLALKKEFDGPTLTSMAGRLLASQEPSDTLREEFKRMLFGYVFSAERYLTVNPHLRFLLSFGFDCRQSNSGVVAHCRRMMNRSQLLSAPLGKIASVGATFLLSLVRIGEASTSVALRPPFPFLTSSEAHSYKALTAHTNRLGSIVPAGEGDPVLETWRTTLAELVHDFLRCVTMQQLGMTEHSAAEVYASVWFAARNGSRSVFSAGYRLARLMRLVGANELRVQRNAERLYVPYEEGEEMEGCSDPKSEQSLLRSLQAHLTDSSPQSSSNRLIALAYKSARLCRDRTPLQPPVRIASRDGMSLVVEHAGGKQSKLDLAAIGLAVLKHTETAMAIIEDHVLPSTMTLAHPAVQDLKAIRDEPNRANSIMESVSGRAWTAKYGQVIAKSYLSEPLPSRCLFHPEELGGGVAHSSYYDWLATLREALIHVHQAIFLSAPGKYGAKEASTLRFATVEKGIRHFYLHHDSGLLVFQTEDRDSSAHVVLLTDDITHCLLMVMAMFRQVQISFYQSMFGLPKAVQSETEDLFLMRHLVFYLPTTYRGPSALPWYESLQADFPSKWRRLRQKAVHCIIRSFQPEFMSQKTRVGLDIANAALGHSQRTGRIHYARSPDIPPKVDVATFLDRLYIAQIWLSHLGLQNLPPRLPPPFAESVQLKATAHQQSSWIQAQLVVNEHFEEVRSRVGGAAVQSESRKYFWNLPFLVQPPLQSPTSCTQERSSPVGEEWRHLRTVCIYIVQGRRKLLLDVATTSVEGEEEELISDIVYGAGMLALAAIQWFRGYLTKVNTESAAVRRRFVEVMGTVTKILQRGGRESWQHFIPTE